MFCARAAARRRACACRLGARIGSCSVLFSWCICWLVATCWGCVYQTSGFDAFGWLRAWDGRLVGACAGGARLWRAAAPAVIFGGYALERGGCWYGGAALAPPPKNGVGCTIHRSVIERSVNIGLFRVKAIASVRVLRAPPSGCAAVQPRGGLRGTGCSGGGCGCRCRGMMMIASGWSAEWT